MPIHKVIFRLDFSKPNFEVLDSAGAIMRIMSESLDIKWEEYRNERDSGTVTGVFANEEKTKYQQLAIQPSTIHFVYEHAIGTEPKDLEESEAYSELFKGAQLLCDFFKSSLVKRSGIRFTYMSSKSTHDQVKEFFRGTIESSLLKGLTEILGEPRDFGIAIDGVSEDKLAYHFKAGPYEGLEAEKQFSFIKDNMKQDKEQSLIIDLDIYEEDFLLTVRPKIWAKSAVRKCTSMVDHFERMLESSDTKEKSDVRSK